MPLALALCCSWSHAGTGTELSFAERLSAENDVQRVYHRHQRGSLPFEKIVPDERLEQRVISYLKESAALDTYWGAPITAATLERELERILRGTRFPDRLEEVFAALDHDPVLILECFVRPLLARRLTRSFFARDDRIHAERRSFAEHLRAAPVEEGAEKGNEWERETIRITRSAGKPNEAGRGNGLGELEPAEFDRISGRIPDAAGDVTEVMEERHRFVVRRTIRRESDSIQFEEYTIRKRTWESWWEEISPSLNAEEVRTLARDSRIDVDLESALLDTQQSRKLDPRQLDECLASDFWDNGTLDDTGRPRTRPSVFG